MKTNRMLLMVVAAVLGGVSTMALSGCGSASASPQALDPGVGVQYLTTALDSWKSGQGHGQEVAGHEGLRVADEDWLAGLKLVEYMISTSEVAPDPMNGLQVPVTLTLKDRRSRTVKRSVVYQVMGDPTPLVVRVGQ